MKSDLRAPLIALFICLMLLPLTSLATIDGDSGGPVAAVTGWGTGETFDNVPTGTNNGFHDFTLTPNYNTDTVVLDGRLWIMFRGNDSAAVAIYAPTIGQPDWAMSFDAFTPRNGASYRVENPVPGLYGLKAMLTGSDGRNLTGIELLVGPANLEGVLTYSGATGQWTRESAGILAALSNRSADQESSPDRYSVTFARTAPGTILLSVVHSKAGIIFTKTIAMDQGAAPVPAIHFYSDAAVGFITTPDVHGPYPVSGGWMLDNFMTRPADTGSFEMQPTIEVVHRSDPLWAKVVDPLGEVIKDAAVTIGGRVATFNATNDRYEVPSTMPVVDWASSTPYTASWGGVTLTGLIKVTTTPDVSAVSVTKWWNGWSWATVFGRDDCGGPQTVLDTYRGYDHPLTAYVFTDNPAGNSSMILPTHSEIGKHGPHDYYNWMKKTWSESVTSAIQGQQALSTHYTFASRWDDPSYVGNGDTYISLANPGNTATFQMEYAQYRYGVRIEGISSNQANGAPGNDSLIGSYGVDPWAKWDPMTPVDLMDAARQLNTDGMITMDRVMLIAQAGGLARFYNHGQIAQPSLLHWVCDNKSGSPENWKATDGEAASYTYGRMTTDVREIAAASTADLRVFEVSRQDPESAGYWLVPVTVSVPINGYTVDSVEIVGGDGTLSSLDHSISGLKNLSGARVMDVGYDIRGGVLYVSAFWNASSELRVHYTPHDPYITNHPKAAIPLGTPYGFNATATEAMGEIAWTLNTDAAFLSIQWSDRTHCLIAGMPFSNGRYRVSLTVSSPLHSDTINYTLVVWRAPDLEPPVTVISGDIGQWINRSAALTLTATDYASGVAWTNYSVDDGGWREWTRAALISPEGRHVVRYYSVDNAGNTEVTKEAVVLIDRHAPEARFNNQPFQQFFGGKALLQFSSWDNLSGMGPVRIIDEAGIAHSVQPGTVSLTLENVAEGNRTFIIQAEDAAGNIMTGSITVNERPGGEMAWNGASMDNVLVLALAAGLLCLPAVILGRRPRS